MALTKVSTGMLSADVASIDLNIDANTMYIDVSSNRVGINNATPSTALDVTGSVTASSTLTAQKLVSTDGILELDDNGTHNGIINSPASLIINIDSDANSTGEDFIISKDRTSTSGGTELFRVQEDGNVGIGTSSPYNNSKLDVLGSIISTSQTIGTYAANNAGFDFAAATKVGRFFSTSSDATGGHMTFITGAGGGNERMRIDASGNLLVGTTSATIDTSTNASGLNYKPGNFLCVSTTVGGNSNVILNKTNSSAGVVVDIRYNGGVVGSISNTASATSYNTSSDYRLKENVVAMSGATERLKQLNPSRFNFIADADTTVDGFLAHEVQDIVPEAITGTKDAVDADGNPEYQGIDQSKLVPLLVATIQELEARIAALES